MGAGEGSVGYDGVGQLECDAGMVLWGGVGGWVQSWV